MVLHVGAEQLRVGWDSLLSLWMLPLLRGTVFILFWSVSSVSMNGGCYPDALNFTMLKAGNFMSIHHILPVCEVLEIRYSLPKLSCNCRFSELEGIFEGFHPSSNTSLCMSLHGSFPLSIHYTYLPFYPYILRPVYIHTSAYPSIHLSTHHAFIYPYIYPSTHPTIQSIEPPLLLVCTFQVGAFPTWRDFWVLEGLPRSPASFSLHLPTCHLSYLSDDSTISTLMIS